MVEPLSGDSKPPGIKEVKEVDVKRSEGGWLKRQWQSISLFLPFRNFMMVMRSPFTSYSKEKAELAHRLAGEDDFVPLLKELSKKSKTEMAMIKEACRQKRLYKQMQKATLAQKIALLRTPTLLPILVKIDKVFPVSDGLFSEFNITDSSNISESLLYANTFLNHLNTAKFYVKGSEEEKVLQELLGRIDPAILPKHYLISQMENFLIIDAKKFMGDPLKQLVEEGNVLNYSSLSNINPDQIKMEHLCQFHFPHDLSNDETTFDTNTTPIEMFIAHPVTKEVRRLSFSLPSPPAGGVMSAKELKKLLEVLGKFYEGQSSYDIEIGLPQIYNDHPGQSSEVFEACKRFYNNSLQQTYNAFSTFKESAYTTPFGKLMMSSLAEGDIQSEEFFSILGDQSLFSLANAEEGTFRFSLLPPVAHPSLQAYATISEKTIYEIAKRIQEPGEVQEVSMAIAPGATIATPQMAALSVQHRDKGEILEVEFSVEYKGKTYSYKVDYPLLFLTPEEVEAVGRERVQQLRINQTIDYLRDNEFLGRDILLAQSSFIKQIDEATNPYVDLVSDLQGAGPSSLVIKLPEIQDTEGKVIKKGLEAAFDFGRQFVNGKESMIISITVEGKEEPYQLIYPFENSTQRTSDLMLLLKRLKILQNDLARVHDQILEEISLEERSLREKGLIE